MYTLKAQTNQKQGGYRLARIWDFGSESSDFGGFRRSLDFTLGVFNVGTLRMRTLGYIILSL